MIHDTSICIEIYAYIYIYRYMYYIYIYMEYEYPWLLGSLLTTGFCDFATAHR